MKIQIISLFPEMLEPYLRTSMMYKAQDIGAVEFSAIDLREYGIGPRRQVDDTPYGGGDGMVLMIEPLTNAVEAAKQKDPTAKVLLMTPRGNLWKQSKAKQYADDDKGLIIICGRYEGYDERVVSLVDEQICIGNYVLTGGELAALIVADSITRLLPNVLGGEMSAELESFVADDKSIEAPQYTRPANFEGLEVPEVLLSGNHAKIARWREANSKQ